MSKKKNPCGFIRVGKHWKRETPASNAPARATDREDIELPPGTRAPIKDADVSALNQFLAKWRGR